MEQKSTAEVLFWAIQLIMGSSVVLYLVQKLKSLPLVGGGVTPILVGIMTSVVGLLLDLGFSAIGQPTGLSTMEILTVTTGQNVVLANVLFETLKSMGRIKKT